MTVDVHIDSFSARRAATRLQREVAQPRLLMAALGREFRDNVKKRMNSRDAGNWAPASKWTRAKKNTNRPLSGQGKNIKSRVVSDLKAEVYYDGVSRDTGLPIKITEHHFGQTLQADGSVVGIPILNPRPLNLAPGTSRFFFRWNKSSVVPARKIWPDGPGEAQRIAEPVVTRWLTETANRVWR